MDIWKQRLSRSLVKTDYMLSSVENEMRAQQKQDKNSKLGYTDSIGLGISTGQICSDKQDGLTACGYTLLTIISTRSIN